MGQRYEVSTPIAIDAVERARAWDARMTAARNFLRVQQRDVQPDRPDNLAKMEHWSVARVGRLTEHTRR